MNDANARSSVGKHDALRYFLIRFCQRTKQCRTACDAIVSFQTYHNINYNSNQLNYLTNGGMAGRDSYSGRQLGSVQYFALPTDSNPTT